MELEGKAAIVTGGATGVGAATCMRLAGQGCAVLVNYNRSKDQAEEIAAAARELGVKAAAVQADVCADANCRRLVKEAVSSLGRLDILVNNAGITHFIPHSNLDDVTDEVWDGIFAVNLKGPFQCARAAQPAIQASGGGEIVMTSSISGLVGTGSSIPYCASKAALNNLVVTLARIMGPMIRVNAVAPGFIAGSWLANGLGPTYGAVKKAMEDKSPLQSVCTPDDVGEAIVGLIAGSGLVTGHVLPVEGGILIGR
jgi:3-oxoacyl-[acyl-carrier protein] reductase